jgi:quercetin 2,3-dioxygenase
MTAEFATPGSLVLPGRPAPFFLAKGDGERAHLFDSLVTVLLSGDETDGQFGFFSFAAPKGEAIPTHNHGDVHETFYVVEGAVRVFIEDQDGQRLERLLEPGDFGYCPAGLNHSFRVEADARMLGTCTGGFERFFAAAGTRTESTDLPMPPYLPSAEQLGAAAAQYHNTFRFDLRLDGPGPDA